MSPLRLPRWTALVVLPLLVGALLLMHGLDAGATRNGLYGAPATATAAAHAHDADTPADHHDAGCEGCAAHVMAACVAIVATVVGLRLARRATGTRLSPFAFSPLRRIRAARQALRPPEPAWVRLAVMRC